ncbi:hypothetical protein [Streptomyces sp. Tu6071]|uniref:hypothetical protein n=1 Tax=Streptomyces sp. Tu6071 TaxID=355249 RepID=UPI001319CD70|nr:hypothetical protein [Streptomyces sp. Tu6071]
MINDDWVIYPPEYRPEVRIENGMLFHPDVDGLTFRSVDEWYQFREYLDLCAAGS